MDSKLPDPVAEGYKFLIDEPPAPPPPSRPALSVLPKALPNVYVVMLLKELLAEAEAGDLRGICVLGNFGGATRASGAGETSLGDQLVCFEDYKFSRLMQRSRGE